MSDFNPITLFFILYESVGLWLWLLLGLSLVLFIGIVMSALKLYRADRPMKRPILAALIAGLIVAVAATFAAPSWTLADVGALSAVVDYAFAFLFGLVPGVIVAALLFMVAARRCASGNAAAF
ncbi:MAG: hypothetical protein RO009_01325 [Pseudorhodoplanes sp.]|jgi:hypothetical protein|nr:hypothetical protein [Pseudorhodoplanes sp.]